MVAGVTVVSGVVLAVVAVDSVTDVWVCEVAGVVLLTLPLVNDVDVALLSVNGVVVASVPTRRIRWREIFLYNLLLLLFSYVVIYSLWSVFRQLMTGSIIVIAGRSWRDMTNESESALFKSQTRSSCSLCKQI